MPEEAASRQEKRNLPLIWFAGCIAIMLGLVFSLYWPAYFSTDDFNNLYWVQRTPVSEILSHTINPASRFFRPLGMIVYWILWKCFDLDPLPFHLVAWLLHCLNVVLVYYLIQQIVRFRFASAMGAVLFAFQAAFTDIYWSFGTIFEILSTLLFLLALATHSKLRHSRWRLPLVVLWFFLGMKSKEMMITLPGVLLLFDLLRPDQSEWKLTRPAILRAATNFTALLLPVAWFVGLNMGSIRTSDSTYAYYFDFSIRTLIDGYTWYLNTLFHTHLQTASYAVLITIVLVFTAQQRNRAALFFLGWVLITLLPVIFLVNHRFDFYWYLPMIGIAGLSAALVRQLGVWVRVKAQPMTVAFGCIAFAVFCVAQYRLQRDYSEPTRQLALAVSREHRSFIEALRSWDQSNLRQAFLFTSAPINFSREIVQSVTQIALRRTDVEAFLVKNPTVDPDPASNSEAMSGDIVALRFDNGKLIDQTASFLEDPEAFLGCIDSGRYALRLSNSEVTAGRDTYSLAIPNVRNASTTILYSLNDQPLKVFNVNLDANGRAKFDVGASTPKGLYRFLAFNVAGDPAWIRSDATITVR